MTCLICDYESEWLPKKNSVNIMISQMFNLWKKLLEQPKILGIFHRKNSFSSSVFWIVSPCYIYNCIKCIVFSGRFLIEWIKISKIDIFVLILRCTLHWNNIYGYLKICHFPDYALLMFLVSKEETYKLYCHYYFYQIKIVFAVFWS